METASDPVQDPAGSELGHKVVRPIWLDLQEEVMSQLDEISIEDLCVRARESGIESEAQQRLDFTI